MGDLHAPILGSVVLSSTMSWMVLHLVLGDEPLFHVAAYHLVSPMELLAYVVLGVGYDQVDRVLSGDVVFRMVVLLALLKIVATSICYASGNAGLIFGPSMFIGAMMGGRLPILQRSQHEELRRAHAGRHLCLTRHEA